MIFIFISPQLGRGFAWEQAASRSLKYSEVRCDSPPPLVRSFSCTDGSCREAYVRHRLTPTSNQPSLQPELCLGQRAKATTLRFERFSLEVLDSISEVSFRAELYVCLVSPRSKPSPITFTPRSKLPRSRSPVTQSQWTKRGKTVCLRTRRQE